MNPVGFYTFVNDRFEKSGRALFLTNDNFLSNDPIILSSEFTITAWVQLKSYMNSQALISFAVNGRTNNLTFGLTHYNSYYNHSIFCYNGFFGEEFRTNTSLLMDKWQHVAFVVSFQNFYVYVDGSEVYSKKSFRSNFFPAQKYLISKVGNLNGYLDDLKIFRKALSKTEIETVMKETNFNLTYTLAQSCAVRDISQEQDYGEIKSELSIKHFY
jgi:hypothetical protein